MARQFSPTEMKLGTLAGPEVLAAFFESPEGLQQAVELGREAERLNRWGLTRGECKEREEAPSLPAR